MLNIVATPIGNLKDITLRALEVLNNADLIIGEEFKEVSRLLRGLEIKNKDLEVLNEHSEDQDILELLEKCQSQNVCLVSDCGTPSFCDPGFQLVKLCREHNIPVVSVPGASSLMALVSLSSAQLRSFYFAGFPPRDKEERRQFFKKLSTYKEPIVLMDTPYRLNKVLQECAQVMPKRKALLGMGLTSAEEEVFENTLQELNKQIPKSKREFVLLIY